MLSPDGFPVIGKRILAFTLLILIPSVSVAQPAKPISKEIQEASELLGSVDLATDGPSLLKFFEQRILSKVDETQLKQLIIDLGSEKFLSRQEAMEKLMNIGYPAKAYLEEALESPDIEVLRRAERVLNHIDRVADPMYLAAAVKMLAFRNPAGTVETLLRFAEATEEEEVLKVMGPSLARVAFANDDLRSKMVAASKDELAAKRSIVGEAFARAKEEKDTAIAIGMLKDRDEQVRRRVALALFDSNHKESVPVLVGLLAELPPERVWQVEDALLQLAGDDAPNVVLDETLTTRHKARDEWAKWWKANEGGIDLSKVKKTRELKGLTLVTVMTNGRQKGKIIEINKQGKILWTLEVDNYPTDAHLLPNGNVIVGDYRSMTVTEYTKKGKTVWQKRMNTNVVSVQPLRNGNLFVATRSQATEFDKERKKQLYTINRSTIYAARKMRNGEIAIVDSGQRLTRYTPQGKQVRSFQLGYVYSSAGQIDVLPNGRVIAPLYSNSQVVEVDSRGKVLWHATVSRPSQAFRLPNGNVLVGCRNARRVVEIDRSGKEVWSYQADGYVTGVSRR